MSDCKACRWSRMWGELVFLWGELDLGRLWFGASWCVERIDSKPECSIKRIAFCLIRTPLRDCQLGAILSMQTYCQNQPVRHNALIVYTVGDLLAVGGRCPLSVNNDDYHRRLTTGCWRRNYFEPTQYLQSVYFYTFVSLPCRSLVTSQPPFNDYS